MRIYTRKGDSGETGLFGGERVSKAHARVEAYGAVDELNAVLGLAIAELDEALADRLRGIQADLFAVGAHLATPDAGARGGGRLPALPDARVPEMEAWMDELDAGLPALKAFILPGGGRAAAALHLARTVCRRAERRVVALEGASVDTSVVVYLNRLSDLLFVLAREANRRAGVDDVLWSPGADGE